MPTLTHSFNFTGTLQEVEIPAGANSIDVYLWGGAGGGGGNDARGGGSGAAGNHIKHTGYDISSNRGQTLQIAVGGGGAGGSSGGGAARGVKG